MANRYWVGGAGTWNASSTANWSATSGGAAGASAPVSADAVIFDANSGTGTCSVASGAACASLTHGAPNITVQFSAALTMGGNLTVSAGVLDLNNNTVTCLSLVCTAAATRTIAFGSTGLVKCTRATTALTFDLYNATVAATITGTPTIELSGNPAAGVTRSVRSTGSSPSNPVSVKVSAGTDNVSLSAGFGYKDIDFTGFAGTLNNNNVRIYGSLTLSTGMTLASGTGATSFLSTSGTQTHTFNGKTLDFPVTFNAPGSTQVLSDALVLGATRTLTLSAGTIRFKSGATSSAGTFAISGSPSVVLNATTTGSAATILQTSGVVAATNATIQDINATGGATWNAFVENNNINAGGNTGWDFGLGPLYDIEFSPALRSFTERNQF